MQNSENIYHQLYGPGTLLGTVLIDTVTYCLAQFRKGREWVSQNQLERMTE